MHKHNHPLHLSAISFGKFIHNKYNDLLIADSLRYLGLSMISLFIPIFLLKTGYPLPAVILLELCMFLLSIILHFVFVVHMHRWGVKKSLVTSYLLNILLFTILYFTEALIGMTGRALFLVLLGLVNITGFTLYWSAHHIYFIKSTSILNSGAKEGTLNAILSLTGIIGPFLGGLLITLHGFNIVFLSSASLLCVASVVLFFSKDIKIKKCHLKKEIILDTGAMRKNLIYFFQGMAFAVTVFLWPIFLFSAVFSFASIGLLYLLSDLAYSIICFVSGRESDKKGNRKLVNMGSMGLGSSLILRVVFATPIGIFFWQTIGGLFSALIHVPLNSGFFRLAHSDYYNKLLNRELYMYLGRITAMLIVFVLLFTLESTSTALGAGIFISGILVFSINFLTKKDNSIMY
jgi:MFS transporter, YQGE family, putative transporter